MEKENFDEQRNLLSKFKEMNPDNELVQDFFMGPLDTLVDKWISLIEDKMSRDFHYLQKMCLFFIMKHPNKRFQLINFGIGTGKSLICSSLSIILH
jgi:hypothetical protein